MEEDLSLTSFPGGTEAESKRQWGWGRQAQSGMSEHNAGSMIYIFNCFLSLAVGLCASDTFSEKFILRPKKVHSVGGKTELKPAGCPRG